MKKNVEKEMNKTIEERANKMEKQEKVVIPLAEIPKLIRPTVSPKNRITAIYEYTDEEGNPLFEMVRQREGQPYICRQKGYNGEYQFNIKGIPRVPYNLVQVKGAIKNGKTIFITEGESKVDTLSELGIVATTVPFKYPNKWKAEYNKYIKGATGIIILQDDDQNGIDFANFTFSSLLEDFAEEKIGIMPITSICPEINKQGADITDIRDFMNNDERLKLILDSIAENI